MSECPVCHCSVDGAFCTQCGSEIAPSNVTPFDLARTKVGLLGCALAGIGVFLPMLQAPIVGQVTYFLNGHGDGVFVLIAAIVSAVASFYGVAFVAPLGGIVTLGFLAFYYTHVQSLLAGAQASMQQNAGIFSGLGDMLLQSVQFEYGFYVMIIGGALMIVSVLIPHPRAAASQPAVPTTEH